MNEQPQILFTGERCRGRQLDQAARVKGWKIIRSTDMASIRKQFCCLHPGAVILDDFPASGFSRTVFYHFRGKYKIPFILLNETPEAMRYIHLDALSALKILHRNAEPGKIIETVLRLADFKDAEKARDCSQRDSKRGRWDSGHTLYETDCC